MKKLKMKDSFKIFVILIVILGCNIANGILFANYGFPENVVYMLIPSLVCVGVLCYYYKTTEKWTKPQDEWDIGHNCHHLKVFYFMFSLSLAVFVILLLMVVINTLGHQAMVNKVQYSILVASTLATITYGIASLRERNYALGILNYFN